MKVREFTESTNEIASILTAISTSFIVPGATQSLHLPPRIAGTLNTDIKHIAHAVLPGLETVFSESAFHIERYLTTTIFPGFVARQLVRCTTAAMMLGTSCIASSKLKFPGLGESFCIVDASTSTVTAVTDAYLAITGYPLEEVVQRSCIFLQEQHTWDQATELMFVNRKNGSSSWNLCFLYPLRTAQGHLQYWLGAQVDVSNSVGSRERLLRILDCTDDLDRTVQASKHPQVELCRTRNKSEIASSTARRTLAVAFYNRLEDHLAAITRLRNPSYLTMPLVIRNIIRLETAHFQRRDCNLHLRSQLRQPPMHITFY
ncbi:hypothetical protein GGR54DRAFT_535647 [Hypoxylon sp. NC1633]|nr:hypothetical protein GGR54DRAFT_535647 [Hypoxylon sp. NC1633]